MALFRERKDTRLFSHHIYRVGRKQDGYTIVSPKTDPIEELRQKLVNNPEKRCDSQPWREQNQGSQSICSSLHLVEALTYFKIIIVVICFASWLEYLEAEAKDPGSSISKWGGMHPDNLHSYCTMPMSDLKLLLALGDDGILMVYPTDVKGTLLQYTSIHR